MQTKIFHTVNSGVYLWREGTGLLIDGIHRGDLQAMSLMPEELYADLMQGEGIFGHLSGTLFTHLHCDHYDMEGLETLLRQEEPPRVYGPGLSVTSVQGVKPAPGVFEFEIGNARILALDTKHDGETYANDQHRTFLINFGEETFLLAGDAVFCQRDIDILRNYFSTPLTAAFLNLYMLCSEDRMRLIRRLAPERIFLYHLPREEDDILQYRRLIKPIMKNAPQDMQPVEVLEHQSWVDNEPADWNIMLCSGRIKHVLS